MRMRIYQSIAKQRFFRNPTDLRQFFRYSSRINLFFEAKCLFDFSVIRNNMTTLPTEFSSLSDDIVHFIFHRHDLFQRNTFENGYLHFKLDPDHRINEKDQECNAGDKPDHQTLSRIGRDIDDHIDRAGDTDQWKHRTEWNLEGARRLWQTVAQDEDVDMRKDVGNHPENRTDKDQKADQLGGIITDISKEKD